MFFYLGLYDIIDLVIYKIGVSGGKQMTCIMKEVNNWMHRNAREVELCLWKVLFEEGAPISVANALLAYQNDDGGFGHALEADNWNPGSTPIAICTAIKYMKMAGFYDYSHPAYQGIIRFLRSGVYRNETGWLFNIPENNDWPRAPWWTYSKEENKKEYVGVTSSLNAFILRSFPQSDSLYVRAVEEAHILLARLESGEIQGDMELEGLVDLLHAINANNIGGFDSDRLLEEIMNLSKNSVCTDPSRWNEYVKRPSSVVTAWDLKLNFELMEATNVEIDWTLKNRGTDGVWPITWKWYGMEQYDREFVLSENWWKAMVAIEKVIFLKKFGQV